jgi:hypothetical protein
MIHRKNLRNTNQDERGEGELQIQKSELEDHFGPDLIKKLTIRNAN